jgi:hypothetical protein
MPATRTDFEFRISNFEFIGAGKGDLNLGMGFPRIRLVAGCEGDLGFRISSAKSRVNRLKPLEIPRACKFEIRNSKFEINSMAAAGQAVRRIAWMVKPSPSGLGRMRAPAAFVGIQGTSAGMTDSRSSSLQPAGRSDMTPSFSSGSTEHVE